ncbi:DNA polymerase III subunit delta' [Bordetella pertussis]|nr:DNA polymerase III subunit delta' [Bordetella pertussis]
MRRARPGWRNWCSPWPPAARAQPAQLAETARWLSRQRGLATHPLNAKLFVHAALQRVVLSCQ